MKKYFAFIAALITLPLFAQQHTAGKGHTEVVEVAGATAKTLLERASDFMTLKKIESRTVGTTISGVGFFIVSYTSVKKGPESGNIKFDVKITVKDGKYKMELTGLRHEGIQGKSTGGSIDLEKPECGETQITPASWAKIKQDAPELLKEFVKDLKSKLANPVKAAPVNHDF